MNARVLPNAVSRRNAVQSGGQIPTDDELDTADAERILGCPDMESAHPAEHWMAEAKSARRTPAPAGTDRPNPNRLSRPCPRLG